jgi:hypothetical protein
MALMSTVDNCRPIALVGHRIVTLAAAPRAWSSGAAGRRVVKAAVVWLLALMVMATASVVFAVPASAACTSVSYKSASYCVASIDELNSGVYPQGARIALRPVAVLSKSSTLRTVGQLKTTSYVEPCQSSFCGSGQVVCSTVWVTTAIDFARLGSRPVVGSAVDVYGTVTASRTLAPTGWVLVNSSYQATGKFTDPCLFL